MLMPTMNQFCYLVQAHCAVPSWHEWHPLWKEHEKTLRDFIFEDILCQWGGVAEIVNNNGPAFVAVVGYLSEKYSIHHIKISPYTSQANGIVEYNTLTYVNPSSRCATTNIRNGQYSPHFWGQPGHCP